MSPPIPVNPTPGSTPGTARGSTPKERPILFSAPMIRAILDGRKVQTRRVMKDQPPCGCYYAMNQNGDKALCLFDAPEYPGGLGFCPPTPTSKDHRYPCPYGGPGDRLWCRETWRPWFVSTEGIRVGFHYRADDRKVCIKGDATYDDDEVQAIRSLIGWPANDAWRPSIHMPRWASRITLEITGVRVERLHEITEEDAKAEGVEPICHRMLHPHVGTIEDYINPFIHLWNDLNRPSGYGWDANPWVWVVEFRRV